MKTANTAENRFMRSMQNIDAPLWTSSCLDLHGDVELQRRDSAMQSTKRSKTALRRFGSIRIQKTQKQSRCMISEDEEPLSIYMELRKG